MSELIQKNDNRATLRWKLLTGASALALTAYVSSTGLVRAEDADQPQIWIELSGQLSQLENNSEVFAPPLMDGRPSMFSPSQKFEKPPRFSIDEDGEISFQPKDSDWAFSASIRYGRSSNKRHVLQQTSPKPFLKYYYSTYYQRTVTQSAQPMAEKFAETRSENSERHLILDFQVGKDVGLGLFGNSGGTSIISAGVRFAQFQTKSNISLKSDPDWHFNYKYLAFLHHEITNGQAFHSNLASLAAQRSFRGIGPSVSWKASAPVMGNVEDGAIVLDWGLNASLLFGRQRTRTHHQSTAKSFYKSFPILTGYVVPHTVSRFPATPDHTRSRRVTVPNVGGFAGLSFRYSDAKISFGYRADIFFNAIDGGIDGAKRENRGFFGPFASISVGVGD